MARHQRHKPLPKDWKWTAPQRAVRILDPLVELEVYNRDPEGNAWAFRFFGFESTSSFPEPADAAVLAMLSIQNIAKKITESAL